MSSDLGGGGGSPTVVAGDPDALDAFTADSAATTTDASTDAGTYGTAAAAYLGAASDTPTALTDRSGSVETALTTLGRTLRRPGAYGAMILQLDRDGDRVLSEIEAWDTEYLSAFVTTYLDNPGASAAEVHELAVGAVARELASDLGAVVDAEELPSDSPETVAALIERLGRYQSDPTFTAAFFDALGTERTYRLLDVFVEVDAIDAARRPPRGAGPDDDWLRPMGFSQNAAIDTVSRALGTASTTLHVEFLDGLFAHGIHEDDGEWRMDSSFPALFRAGTFSTPWATDIGQLGVDLLAGQRGDRHIATERGNTPYTTSTTNPRDFNPHNVEELSSILLTTAARTPEAANAVLTADDGHAAWILTDYDFQRGGWGQDPQWSQLAGGVNAFLTAGAVTYGATDPAAAREAAAHVIDHGIANLVEDEEDTYDSDGYDRDNAELLAPTWGAISSAYLADFAFSSDVEIGISSEGLIELPTVTSVRVLSLGMRDEDARVRLAAQHQQLAFQLGTAGLAAYQRDPHEGLADELGRLDGIMVAAQRATDWEDASDDDQAVLEHNANVDSAFSFLGNAATTGLAYWNPAGVVLGAPGVSDIKGEIISALAGPFHQDPGYVDAHLVTVVEGGYSLEKMEGNTLAMSALAVALEQERLDPEGLTADQAEVIALAEDPDHLGTHGVDQLRDVLADPDSYTPEELASMDIDADGVTRFADESASYYREYVNTVHLRREAAQSDIASGDGVWP